MYNSATHQREKTFAHKGAVIKRLPSFISPYRQSESGRLIMTPNPLGIVLAKAETTRNV